MIAMQPLRDELRHPADPTTGSPTDPTPESILTDFPDLDPDFDPIALLRDWLEAADHLSLFDLCEIHRLTLPQLERLLAHPFFTQRLAAHARLSNARAAAVRAASLPAAAATLNRIATARPDTRDQRLANESQRKAAAALTRAATRSISTAAAARPRSQQPSDPPPDASPPQRHPARPADHFRSVSTASTTNAPAIAANASCTIVASPKSIDSPRTSAGTIRDNEPITPSAAITIAAMPAGLARAGFIATNPHAAIGTPKNAGIIEVMLAAPDAMYAPIPSNTSTAPNATANLPIAPSDQDSRAVQPPPGRSRIFRPTERPRCPAGSKIGAAPAA